jgi:autotransporter-associated beta strand protein
VVDYVNGVTIANPIIINSNTTQLQVTTGTATQAGVISELNGPRPLEKIGAGTLVLTAANTYSGPTMITAGALIVSGSIANSAVTVANGAMLGGTGTVGATTILSGGIFTPGATGTPGAMTIAGNLAFQSGALYVVQVNPSSASLANVTASGTATLAGTVGAMFSTGSYATRSYTIVSAAGGRSGTFSSLSTTNLPAGFTASLSYTATDAILNLTATLGQPTGPNALGTGGLSGNQKNVANALNNFFNNGGTLPPGFVTIFGLTGANLANALTLLSGEAATGGQQVAFQLTNQFLGIMLDPFVDGRGDVLGGSAIGFAPEHEELPDDIALAYSKVLKAPPKPPSFEQRWSVWGAGYGGSNRHHWRYRGGRHPRSIRAHGRRRGRSRLSPRARHGRRLRARRRRHQLVPRARARGRQERCVPGRCLRHDAMGPGLSRRGLRLHQSLDVDRPLRLCRRPSHRKLQRAEFRRTRGKRLPLHDDLWRSHALRGHPGAKLPHPELQRDRSQRRWLRARL